MKKFRCALSSCSAVGWRSTALILAVLSIFAMAGSAFAQDDATDTTDSTDPATVQTIMTFGTMIGDPGTGTAAAKAKNVIRGYMGPSAPWLIKSATGTLKTDGTLTVMVKGLVLPNGTNPVPFFRAAVSCQDPTASTKGKLYFTKTFAANTAGDSTINGKVALPAECIAPVVLVTSPAAAGSPDGVWFAVTGRP